MTTLVTGATGFVGAVVARLLLARGEAVRVLARAGSDRRNIAGLDVEVVEGDLNDHASLRNSVKGCSALYHVAADYRLFIPQPESIYQTNVEGSRALMLAAAEAGVSRMVYTSSVATLGINADGTPSNETTPVHLENMIGHYKRSKFLAEAAVQSLIDEHALPIVIVNPSTPIGPYDIKPTPTGRMILDAVQGKTPAYVDTGLNLVHVEDVARGHLLAFDHGQIGQRYILGGEDRSLKAILSFIAHETDQRPPRIRLPHNFVLPIAYVSEAWARITNGPEPRATVDGVRMSKKKMFFSSDKAKKELGYSHRSAEAALHAAITWFQHDFIKLNTK